MKIIDTILARFDAFQRQHPFVGFPFAVIKKYGEDEAGRLAALLAYYLFLSIFPLLLVLATVLKLTLSGDGALQRSILQGVTNYIPVIGGELSDSVHGIGTSGVALVIGVALTLFGARGVADSFRGTVNHLWQVPRHKRAGFWLALLKSFGVMLIGSVGLLAAPLLSGYAVGFSHEWYIKLVALAMTAILIFGLFIFLVRTASSAPRTLSDLWVGGVIASLSLLLLQGLGSYLLTHELKHLQSLYSTFALVLGLLYWIYLQTQVLLYALEVDSVRVLRLYPRSVDQKYLTEADRVAFRLYAHRSRYHEEEEIAVKTKRMSA